jgi:30S ribosome assembly GTPase
VPEIFTELVKGHHRIIIVANKIDTLPPQYNIDRLSNWVKVQV